jgi:hypothetical protein
VVDPFVEFIRSLHPAWHADALCLEHPGLPWVSSAGANQHDIARMRAVCGRCAVQDECLGLRAGRRVAGRFLGRFDGG